MKPNWIKMNMNQKASFSSAADVAECRWPDLVSATEFCLIDWKLLDSRADDWKVYASHHNLIHHKGYISISDAIGTLVTFMSITRWMIFGWSRLENGKSMVSSFCWWVLKLCMLKLPTNAPLQHAQKAAPFTPRIFSFLSATIGISGYQQWAELREKNQLSN